VKMQDTISGHRQKTVGRPLAAIDERPSSLCRKHRRKGLAVGAPRTLIFHDTGGLVGNAR